MDSKNFKTKHIMENKEKINFADLTPEAAYKRILEFAEKMRENYPKPNYSTFTNCKFDWDPNSIYTYEGKTSNGLDIFSRNSDGAFVIMTKY